MIQCFLQSNLNYYQMLLFGHYNNLNLRCYKWMSQTPVQAKGAKMYISAAILIIAVSGWALFSVNHSKKQKKKKAQAIARQSINSQTIIFAFQPENLFIKLRGQEHQKCKSLKRSQAGILNQMRNIFKNQQAFYQQKVSAKNLRKMFKQLSSQKNVKLMIYTKLQKQFLTQILDDFGISCYFEQENLIVMQSEHKSAEEIDDETRRVVIISANKEDRNESILGSNHKLILNIPDNHHLETETLDNLQLFLTKLAAAREIDNLHEMMHELAIDMDLPLLNDEI